MSEVIYTDFIRGVKHPKITWIMDRLKEIGVPHRIHGESIHGPVLQIEKGREGLAMDIVNLVVGELFIGVTNKTITIGDLPDNHEIFESTGTATVYPPHVQEALDTDWGGAGPDAGDIVEVQETAQVVIVPKSTASGKVPVDMPKKMARTYGKPPEGPVIAKSVPPVVEVEGWNDDDWGDDPEPDGEETITQKADRLIKWQDQLIMVDPAKSFTCRVYEINSSHMSSMGAMPMFPSPVTIEDRHKGMLWVYVGFKGGKFHYRYFPVTQVQWEELLTEAVDNVVSKRSAETSVGKVFWDLLRGPAEAGKIVCQRYDMEGVWTPVSAKDPKVQQQKRDR